MNTDSHIHLYDFFRLSGSLPVLPKNTLVCASAHAEPEFAWHESFALHNPGKVFLSFGIHPQEPDPVSFAFLETLIKGHRIQAIGECGFDLYSEKYREKEKQQIQAWNFQLECAVDSGLPLVIHCRKAMNHIFADTKKLKKLSAAVFHGWPGSLVEAESLLSRGINAYFSAGKGLLRGDKSLLKSVSGLPSARLLTETDAPYMHPASEKFSTPDDILQVTQCIASLKMLDVSALGQQIYTNFSSVFADHPVFPRVP